MKQASTLDRDITQALGEPSADSRQQAAKFRIILSRLQAKTETLDPAGKMRLAGKIAGMMRKLELLRQAHQNAEAGKPHKTSPHKNQRITASLPSAGSTIRGHVTDANTGRAITQGVVNIYDTDTYWITSASVNVFGNYNATGLSSGTYYAVAKSDGYVGEYYDNYQCSKYYCWGAGTPITVSGNDTVSGIDFALSKGGIIAGSVTDSVSHAGIDGQIEIFDEVGDLVAYGYTDATGAYQADPLPAGEYYAATVTDGIYIDEIYDNIPWSGNSYPDALAGAAITVTQSQTTSVDFALDVGGSISGTLTDEATGFPVSDGVVDIHDLNGDYAAYGISDSEGHYRASGLLSGAYHATSYAAGDYLPMNYNAIPCDWWCDPGQGTPIFVTAPQDTGGIDFALTLGGRISGTLTDAGTGLPLDYAFVDIYNSQGEYVSYGYTYLDYAGSYTTSPPVPAVAFFCEAFAMRFPCDSLQEPV